MTSEATIIATQEKIVRKLTKKPIMASTDSELRDCVDPEQSVNTVKRAMGRLIRDKRVARTRKQSEGPGTGPAKAKYELR